MAIAASALSRVGTGDVVAVLDLRSARSGRRLFPLTPAPSSAVTIGARTEHLRIVRSATAAHGRVTWIEHLGDRNHLHVRIGDSDVVTLADPDAGLGVGDDVAIEFVRPLYFDKEGNRVTV